MRPLKLFGLGLGLAGLALTSSASAEPPAEPRVLDDIPEIGERGGEIRTLIRRAKDAKLFVVYGYARLVGYDRDLELVPDILKDVEVEEGRRFTFHLREGHKWSDGEPFTAEDFRFFWEDVAQHEALRPTGPPIQMVVDGELPEFEILDERTVRYTWSKPNPFFLPALAGAAPLEVALPAHYLKPLHQDYADPDALAAKVEAEGARDWAQLFGRHSDEYDATDPDLPTLQPWRLVTPPPAQRVVTERNPHFHRVDPEGTQLPYVDRVTFQIVESSLIPVKTGGGEVDLQARGLNFSDVTFLKRAQERSGLRTLLWKTASAAHLALYPNLNAKDEVWREVFRDRRVRRALSLGIDRAAISEFLYFGVAEPANNTLLPESPLWTDDIGLAYTDHDVERADALLDEAGLAERNGEGIRLLPDGRPMEIIVETAGEDTEHADALELVASHWREIGVKLLTKPSQREVLRNRIFAGDTLMTIAKGIENGLVTAEMSPAPYAPTSQIHYQWPKWGQYYETKGDAGTAPDMAGPERLFALFEEWRVAAETDQRREIWNEMLEIWSDGVYTFGIVSGVPQPVAVKPDLVNVPEEAVYNWDPGAHFGIYHPDTFWWRDQG
ncbi:MAG: ABC transporter substrate-binding protein [Alphaproteobacteria bacterium]|nr:ABC transporter substrate-binding protein [Alphaproteobacteria bacterium]